MPLLGATGGGSAKGFGALANLGYYIKNSLRFRASATAYLSRTPTLAGNRKTWTLSYWMKRGALSVASVPFQAGSTGSEFTIDWRGFDAWDFYEQTSSTQSAGATTNAVYRDPSAWYHVVFAYDTTQATAANRWKLYINGTQVTSFSATQYPTQNSDGYVNSTVPHYFGIRSGTTTPFDGYLADINFIDGQALTPSSFGKTDAVTGQWIPKKFAGTYGTNGFYLKFSDIATTSGSNAGLGKDFSGNANYWTTNNISVTSGTTYDAMIDSPTNASSSGTQPVGNYCTWNPLDALTASTFQNGNLQITTPSAGGGVSRATMGLAGGKFYWEVVGTTNGNYLEIGILKSTDTSASYLESQPGGYSYLNNGQKCNNSVASSYGNSYTTNDVIGVAFDTTTGSLYFSKNGTWQNSGDPVAGTGYAYTGLTADTYMPAISDSANTISSVASVNFGQRPFAYTPPTGFKSLCTTNLPDSTIVQGNKYMDATLYTGNSSTQTITNAGAFKPDLVWLKCRSTTGTWNNLVDSVRGTSKTLYSNTTNAEGTDNYLSAFNSNGFGLNSGDSGTNTSGNTYVGWQWQAGQGSTSSNTSGSITSTVSVNTTAGFSVVTYTGTGSAATVGHGLGVAPRMIIIKNRGVGTAGNGEWQVYHASLGNTQYLALNTTAAAATATNRWNNTSPTSSVFTVATTGSVNDPSNTYVAYCWAEIAGFSKFGSYTGNGSADGPMVYLNFAPKFIMLKRTDTIGNWTMYDSIRNTYNAGSYPLYPNLSNAEDASTDHFDWLSNGFKMRSTNQNTNGGTYIYMAFATNPFSGNNRAR